MQSLFSCQLITVFILQNRFSIERTFGNSRIYLQFLAISCCILIFVKKLKILGA